MKHLSYEEFKKRIEEVNKARKIFIKSGLTKNITKAFEIYQELLIAEEDQLSLTIDNEQLPFNNVERPTCSECDTELKIRTAPRTIDGNHYRTAWVCENCGIEYYSELTAKEWYVKLRSINEDSSEEAQAENEPE